jgi:hypothetical protein
VASRSSLWLRLRIMDTKVCDPCHRAAPRPGTIVNPAYFCTSTTRHPKPIRGGGAALRFYRIGEHNNLKEKRDRRATFLNTRKRTHEAPQACIKLWDASLNGSLPQ